MGTFVFKMPDIGEGIVEAEVVEWHVAVGDDVKEDAPVADVMTDKATVEITAPVAGVVRMLGCAAGEKMVIGSPFVEFETAGADAPETTAGKAAQPGAASEAPVEPAAAVEADPVVPAVQSTPSVEPDPVESPAVESPDKALETPSLPPVKPKIRVVSDGQLPEIAAAASAGESSSTVAPPNDTPAVRVPVSTPVAAESGTNTGTGNNNIVELSPRREIVPASPAVRRLARDLGIDLAAIRGTGPAGRVTNQDIRRLVNAPAGSQAGSNPEDAYGQASATNPVARSSGAEPVAQATPPVNHSGLTTDADVTTIPVTGVRRLIAERLQVAKQRIPHFSYVEEVRVDALESLRAAMNDSRTDAQPKLSVLHFVLLAVCREVVNWPQCNAHFDDEANELSQHAAVHLGVATMTDNGLMVPVVAHASRADIWQIASEVNRLAESARAGTLKREELTGSTITVTSLGPLAGIATTPVINRPETAIIGPNKIMQKVVWENGAARPVQVMNLSSSFDHRIVDGYDAACFIQAVKRRLEEPALLFA